MSEEGNDSEALRGDREMVRMALVRAFNDTRVVHQAWTWRSTEDANGESETFVEMYRSPPFIGLLIGAPGASQDRDSRAEMIASNGELTVVADEGGIPRAVLPAAGALNLALPVWREAQALIGRILGADPEPLPDWSASVSIEFDPDSGALRPGIHAVRDCVERASWLKPASFERLLAVGDGRVQVEGVFARVVLRQADGVLESMEALDDKGRVTHSLRPHAVAMTADEWPRAIAECCARVPDLEPGREQVQAWVLFVLQQRALDAARVLRTIIEAEPGVLGDAWSLQGILEILVGTLYAGQEDLADYWVDTLDAQRADGQPEDAPTRVAGRFFATVWPHFEWDLERSGAGPMAITRLKDSLWRLHAQRARGVISELRER